MFERYNHRTKTNDWIIATDYRSLSAHYENTVDILNNASEC
jgi:hypothetical protein